MSTWWSNSFINRASFSCANCASRANLSRSARSDIMSFLDSTINKSELVNKVKLTRGRKSCSFQKHQVVNMVKLTRELESRSWEKSNTKVEHKDKGRKVQPNFVLFTDFANLDLWWRTKKPQGRQLWANYLKMNTINFPSFHILFTKRTNKFIKLQ